MVVGGGGTFIRAFPLLIPEKTAVWVILEIERHIF